MKEQTTSIDYKIVEATGVLNVKDLTVIRDKNRSCWQSKTPRKEIKIEINFVPSRLSHVEIGEKLSFFQKIIYIMKKTFYSY